MVLRRFLYFAVVTCSTLIATGANAAVINNWITWTPPTTYGNLAKVTDGSSQGYTYASGATGTILLPGGSTVGVNLSGEVVNPNAFAGDPGIGPSSKYGSPSGFDSNSTTYGNYWSTRPATNGSTYISPNVPSYPTHAGGSQNNDHIGLIGGNTDGLKTQTITFDAPVSNIVMLLYSLGRESDQAVWSFSQNFDILSDNNGTTSNGQTGRGLSKSLSGGKYLLTGREGSGAIQFVGTFNQFSWTVSDPELWASWNIGVTSAPPPSEPPSPGAVPEPSSLAVFGGISVLAAVAAIRRRRVISRKQN